MALIRQAATHGGAIVRAQGVLHGRLRLLRCFLLLLLVLRLLLLLVLIRIFLLMMMLARTCSCLCSCSLPCFRTFSSASSGSCSWVSRARDRAHDRAHAVCCRLLNTSSISRPVEILGTQDSCDPIPANCRSRPPIPASSGRSRPKLGESGPDLAETVPKAVEVPARHHFGQHRTSTLGPESAKLGPISSKVGPTSA